MNSRRFILPLLAAFLMAFSPISASRTTAEELVWTVRSEHPSTVSLEFYSQDRRQTWPGGGNVHVIDDWDTHSYTLNCNRGENICFGAWVSDDASIYWGAGMDGIEACRNCCAICGQGGTWPQVLKP